MTLKKSDQAHHRMRNKALALHAAGCLLALGAAAVPALAAPVPEHRVPDTLQQRLLACTGCHGKDGQATSQGYFPRIAGKPAAYLYLQLLNFREGRRHNGNMVVMVEHMTDAYMRRIAEHFAELDLPYPPPQTADAPPALLAAGERLVRHGDPQRGLPACTACHGAAMTGVLPAVPGLLGLPRDYVVGQLGAWQTGLRKAVAPDCMAQVAKQLTAADITAVSTWLSAQPMPANSKPSAPNARPLPLSCGGPHR